MRIIRYQIKNEAPKYGWMLEDNRVEVPGYKAKKKEQQVISIERFQSLTDDKKVLSLSFWENEEAVAAWRKLESHRTAQALGHDELFRDYRICVASVVRDYSINARDEAPADSRASLE